MDPSENNKLWILVSWFRNTSNIYIFPSHPTPVEHVSMSFCRLGEDKTSQSRCYLLQRKITQKLMMQKSKIRSPFNGKCFALSPDLLVGGQTSSGQLANLFNLHLQNSKKTSHPKLSSEPCETFHYAGNLQNPRKVPRPPGHLQNLCEDPVYMPMLGGNCWKWQNIYQKINK